MRNGLGKHISLASALAFAVASGAAIAADQQQAQGADQSNLVTSTDEMERLAKQGKPVPQGQLDPDEVADATGEQQPGTQQGAAAQEEEQQQASAQGEDGKYSASPLPQPEPENDVMRNATAPMKPVQRAGDQPEKSADIRTGVSVPAGAGPDEEAAQGGGSAQGSGSEDAGAQGSVEQQDQTGGQDPDSEYGQQKSGGE